MQSPTHSLFWPGDIINYNNILICKYIDIAQVIRKLVPVPNQFCNHINLIVLKRLCKKLKSLHFISMMYEICETLCCMKWFSVIYWRFHNKIILCLLFSRLIFISDFAFIKMFSLRDNAFLIHVTVAHNITFHLNSLFITLFIKSKHKSEMHFLSCYTIQGNFKLTERL